MEQRLQWEMLLLEEEKDVCDTLQQRQAIQVWLVKHSAHSILTTLLPSIPQSSRYVPLLRGFIDHDIAISRLMHVPHLC